MEEKEFNLLDEPWIRVIDSQCNVKELSMLELFERAHEYVDFSGETAAQDIAVLRLLIAVLLTVFSQYSMQGNQRRLRDNKQDAFAFWKRLWENEKFPIKPIKDYLETQREKFWLFHPENPFGQTAKAKIGTSYDVPKLNGELSESSNKTRLFQSLAGENKKSMSYSQACRWLIYINAFDDTSAKPSKEAKAIEKETKEKLPSPGAGWLGKLGLIINQGNNIFETLMLNFILCDSNRKLFPPETPVWELDKMPSEERRHIARPNNLSALYTLQSRRLFLNRCDNAVVGFNLLGGDFFDKEDTFIEPMTVWRGSKYNKKTKKYEPPYVPKRHDISKQFWREFASVYTESDATHQPGVIIWLNQLMSNHCLSDKGTFRTKIASVQYGDKDFFVTNTFSDTLSMHRTIFENEVWQDKILNAIERCDKIASYVFFLAKNLNFASGGSDSSREHDGTAKIFATQAQAKFYTLIDIPFRMWLSSLDPNEQDEDVMLNKWTETAVEIAGRYGKELSNQAGLKAFTGKIIKKENEPKKFYSVAMAINSFQAQLYKLKPKKEEV